MALPNVPREHLAYRFASAFSAHKTSGAKSEAILKKLTSKDPGEVKEALDFLDKLEPGTRDELTTIWEFKTPRAILLWRLPYLRNRRVKDALPKKAPKVLGQWQTIRAEPRDDEDARVRRACVLADEIEAEVFINKKSRYRLEEERKTYLYTSPVKLRITFSGAIPLVQAYATSKDARSALFTCLDWLREELTPRNKSKEQQLILEPVVFTEQNVIAFTKKHMLGLPTEVSGIDPTNEVGHITMTGHRDEFALTELNPKSQKVKDQLAAENTSRRHKFNFIHADGFVENTQVSFHFNKSQSHVSFHTKTSRPAIDDLFVKLRVVLGI